MVPRPALLLLLNCVLGMVGSAGQSACKLDAHQRHLSVKIMEKPSDDSTKRWVDKSSSYWELLGRRPRQGLLELAHFSGTSSGFSRHTLGLCFRRKHVCAYIRLSCLEHSAGLPHPLVVSGRTRTPNVFPSSPLSIQPGLQFVTELMAWMPA